MSSVRSFIRQQGIALLALVLALTGGVAYAANTIFSEDIVNGEVKAVDLANNAVRSAKIANGQVATVDLADDAVGAAKIQDSSISSAKIQDSSITSADVAFHGLSANNLPDYQLIAVRGGSLNDGIGGSPTDTLLIDNAAFNFQIIGRCDQPSAGAVTAKILYKSVSANSKTNAVDSTAPGGANDSIVPHNTEATLLSLGPTTGTHVGTGTFTAIRFRNTDNTNAGEFFGNVSATTNFGGPDCRFQASVFD